jgi:vacuolar-type H+-ATPase subunit H
MGMSDVKSEEFKRFILENRELIEAILNEDKEPAEKKEEKPFEELKEEKLDEAKAIVKDLNDSILKIVSDEDVQKHFITGCLEFLHFFESIIDAAPLSPEVREVVDKFERTRNTTVRNVVSVGAKDKIENITINDVKKSASSTRSKTIEKIENISIRDIKDSIKERFD